MAKTKSAAKRRNTAIEFWRFIVSIFITGYHISFIFPMVMPDDVVASPWMTNGETLFIFTLTSGYFLMAHFKSRQKNEGFAEQSAASRAWSYLKGRLDALLPVLILGVFMGLVSCAIYYKSDIVTVLNSFVNGLWEYLGTYALGFTAAYGQANGALWFISALFVCSYLLYYALCVNEDRTVGLLVPVLFFGLEGWWCKTGIRASQQAWSTIGSIWYANNMAVNGAGGDVAIFGANNGLIFVMVGMCGVILIWEAINALQKHEFTAKERTCLTILNVIVSLVLLFDMINPTWFSGFPLERMTVHLLCCILIFLTLLNKDGLTALLNNDACANVFQYLGSISMYVYMVHQPVIYVMVAIMGYGKNLSFNQLFLPVTAVSLVLSVIIKKVMDSRKKKA